MYGTNNQSSNRNSWMDDNDDDNARFSHGNASESRYSNNYGQSMGNDRNMGSNYNEDRYRQNRSHNTEHEDEGFFGRISHGIKDAWNNITGDDDDSNRGNYSRNSGPPYHYGSGSNSAGW